VIEPIFIRVDGFILNIVDIKNIWYHTGSEKTYLSYHSDTNDVYLDGDVRDELWGLIKISMAKRSGNVVQLDAEPQPTPIITELELDTRVVIGELFNGTPIYAQ
tara:strand:- start:761 stop:1072 length:312 start_codon:yes stop_codon:yes gene_type:complete